MMLTALLSLTALGVLFGLLLGIANRFFRVEGDPVATRIESLMPGTNCGQCGYPGCAAAAAAIVAGSAEPSCCPAGGTALVQDIADCLGIQVDLSAIGDRGPVLAAVAEEICIGCCRCIKVCPTDAIVGSTKQIHSVLRDACTGCGACIDRCPTEAMSLQPITVTLPHWVWPKPLAA